MFLSNTINSPVPYIRNEDELTAVRDRRATWREGTRRECKHFLKKIELQQTPHHHWMCHIGIENKPADSGLDITKLHKQLPVKEYIQEHHVQMGYTPQAPSGLCFDESKCRCTESKQSDCLPEKIEEIQPPNKECYKVTVEQPRLVPTELAPKYQVKSGKVLRVCACTRKNGLQDRCEMSRCMGRKECMAKPIPLCTPSGTQELVKKVYEVCCEFGNKS